MQKKKRPRILQEKLDVIIDEHAYLENSSSKNARKIKIFSDNIETEFWIDKHYSIRQQHGDDDGKREGIELEFVEDIITKAFKYLKYFNFKVEKFLFVNFPPKKIRPIRIVLKQFFEKDLILNIVVEYHFVDINLYEVTVFTAIRKENFILSDGQYGIFFDIDSVKLIFSSRSSEKIIDEIKYK